MKQARLLLTLCRREQHFSTRLPAPTKQILGAAETGTPCCRVSVPLEKYHGAAFQIYARDLIEINGREYQCPQNRRPEHGILEEEVRDVSKRGRNRKPTQPQNVPHRV